MIHEIATCLWFDKNAKEAADFYQSTFSGFDPLSENPMAVNYRLFDRRFMHLNGGPGYPINPSISFFLNLEDEEEIKRVWVKLTENGTVLMDLNTYPWSPLYGWCADQFGVNWQIMMNHESHAKLAPNLMFNGVNNGRLAKRLISIRPYFRILKYCTRRSMKKGNMTQKEM